MCLQTLNDLGISYINWYEDEKCLIAFDKMPDIELRYINRYYMSKKEIEGIRSKPYTLNNSIKVLLIDKEKNKHYTFDILKDYIFDGASVPRIFWRAIGPKGDIRFLIGALLHDNLCENHSYVDNDRYFADKIFERCLFVGDTPPLVRWLMFHSVDNFQKFCGWEKK